MSGPGSLLAIEGSPFDAGRAYGVLAREPIRRTIGAYQELVQLRSGLKWRDAVDFALGYDECLGDLAPRSREELVGVADGASLPFGDVLAVNCRSELLFIAGDSTAAREPVGECSSFALVRDRAFAGQNWDWNPGLSFSTTVRGVVPAREPVFLVISEAGHLAKAGFNSAGLGVFTNTLVSSTDQVVRGLPYHILLRELLRFGTVEDAVGYLGSVPRAMSANYLLVDRTGDARDLETVGGTGQEMAVLHAVGGALCHTNHFTESSLAPLDARAASNAHTFSRLAAMGQYLSGEVAGPAHVFRALRDHDGFPNSLCSHPSPGEPVADQRSTLASVVVDVTASTVWVSMGHPCSNTFLAYRVGVHGISRVPELDEEDLEPAASVGGGTNG